MGGRIHALAQQLTGKTTIEECSVEEIKHITNRHPYFAPAQFLLLQKLRQTGASEEAEKQYQKAVLYFHDPLQFEHFISSEKFLLDQETFAPSVSEVEAVSNYSSPEVAPESSVSNVVEAPVLLTQVEEIEATTEADKEEITASPDIEQPLQQQDIPLIEVSEEVSAGNVVDKELKTVVAETTEEEPIQVQSVDSLETKTSSEELTFEPFHTVDYFASQGIKISQEELPKDKLGKQLKSFTEWLKTMKRLPAAQMEQSVESSAEKKVESMASHSVTESNVVTEAMAEVWLKQGNKEKALDIYNKLSLLNPSKKAYFAAKIENLKLS